MSNWKRWKSFIFTSRTELDFLDPHFQCGHQNNRNNKKFKFISLYNYLKLIIIIRYKLCINLSILFEIFKNRCFLNGLMESFILPNVKKFMEKCGSIFNSKKLDILYIYIYKRNIKKDIIYICDTLYLHNKN